jgi:hypothetical protein
LGLDLGVHVVGESSYVLDVGGWMGMRAGWINRTWDPGRIDRVGIHGSWEVEGSVT